MNAETETWVYETLRATGYTVNRWIGASLVITLSGSLTRHILTLEDAFRLANRIAERQEAA